MSFVVERVWFIRVTDQAEGPFTKAELKIDLRLTPDTLVRREGFSFWRPIKEVEELKDLFDETAPDQTDLLQIQTPPDEELALQIQKEPPYFLFWVLVLVVAIGYAAYLYMNYTP